MWILVDSPLLSFLIPMKFQLPKVIADFIKKNNILTFKMGIMGDRIMTQSEVVSLAQTPSKEVSLGKLLYLLNFNISKLVSHIGCDC